GGGAERVHAVHTAGRVAGDARTRAAALAGAVRYGRFRCGRPPAANSGVSLRARFSSGPLRIFADRRGGHTRLADLGRLPRPGELAGPRRDLREWRNAGGVGMEDEAARSPMAQLLHFSALHSGRFGPRASIIQP